MTQILPAASVYFCDSTYHICQECIHMHEVLIVKLEDILQIMLVMYILY